MQRVTDLADPRRCNPCTLIEIDKDYCAKIAEEHGMKRSQYIHRAIWQVD